MKHAVIGEAKEHYKAYKAGKQWIYACITVVAVGLGLAGANVGTAQAATTCFPRTMQRTENSMRLTKHSAMICRRTAP